MQGEDIEFDKNLIEFLFELFIYLLRNSIDYGIEFFVEWFVVGKFEVGCIDFIVMLFDDSVIIEICDDGKGIDF